MAQLLGAKELHFFVANSSHIYDYSYDTEVDILTANRFLDFPLVHYLLMSKLYTFRIIRKQ
jgi:hypothetical protein